MNVSKRNLFAGKGRLVTEPFCPFITDQSGYASLLRKGGRRSSTSRQKGPRR